MVVVSDDSCQCRVGHHGQHEWLAVSSVFSFAVGSETNGKHLGAITGEIGWELILAVGGCGGTW